MAYASEACLLFYAGPTKSWLVSAVLAASAVLRAAGGAVSTSMRALIAPLGMWNRLVVATLGMGSRCGRLWGRWAAHDDNWPACEGDLRKFSQWGLAEGAF